MARIEGVDLPRDKRVEVGLTYSHAIDVATVASPNIRVRGTNGTPYVVPGRWTVVNTTNADGTTSSVLTFTPFFKLPANDSITVETSSGFRGTNGRQDVNRASSSDTVCEVP